MRRPLDFDLLRTFTSVVEERSFTKAGFRLNLTQQSVSAQIARLESAVGRRLLDRLSQGVEVTQDGEALLLYSRHMVALSHQIDQHFSSVPLAGNLRLGLLEGVASTSLPFVLGRLRRMQPKLAITAETGSTETLLQRFHAGQLDLMLGGQRPGEGIGEPLWQDKLVWVGDDEGWTGGAEPIPLVMLPAPTQVRTVALEELRLAGHTWVIFFESDNRASLRAAVLAGLGYTVFCRGIMTGMDDDLPLVAGDRLPDLGSAEFFMLQKRGELVAMVAAAIRAVAPAVARLAGPMAF